MRIVPPQASMSSRDKEILALMSKLLLDHLGDPLVGANLPAGRVALSDREAFRLLELLNALIESRAFVESAFLIEELSKGADRNDEAMRNVYLRNRASRGRTRIMASTKWADFLSRLGLSEGWHPYIGKTPMSDAQFLEMERRLFVALGLSEAVADLLLKFVRATLPEVRAALSGDHEIPSGTIRRAIIEPFRAIGRQHSALDRTVSAAKVAAGMTLVANLSVLFSTRDWDVTGTMSGMSGALTALVWPDSD